MRDSLTHYDPTEDLASDTAIATFMAEAFATEDASYIAHALGVAARAKGMSDPGHEKAPSVSRRAGAREGMEATAKTPG